ncbi:glycerol-3-phosphate dehydrogenase/oxidase [Nocardioides bruguierae]|uniref:Glycerol-3-phosphate dehydrogenase/oxidase n=1 Tax=Nocardioides bruguierae TaxID=2945102 RepID=A0A9X2D6I8_9ACTN|nr:glycerol-3-phosphate dehydrogenase/oxidase [Nocardioides bruguierae]MCM0620231.1 glycerol-3-phosphate dehydrogenase/oxidase [Nocardioides bruguierae]
MTPGTTPRVRAGLADAPTQVDVLVVGLGATGAGVALDAAARGLRVLAVDAHDLAHGTSRWSSKLVHGGLRYLAHGQVGVARESAVERGLLMSRTAPHLTHPLPMLVPLAEATGHRAAAVVRTGLAAGDLLRHAAGAGAGELPRSRRVGAAEALALAPALRPTGLRGGLLGWDGRLEDDARLVITLARTAAQHGAHVRTRVRVVATRPGGADLLDTRTGEQREVRARLVVNATGVWAGDLDPSLRLTPSRGTHLVVRTAALGGLSTALSVPVPGERARFVLLLPQPDGTTYVGLTDEPAPGPVPDVPEPTPGEVAFLLDVLGGALAHPPGPADLLGAFAGLRPLLAGAGGSGTADLSRRHAVRVRGAGSRAGAGAVVTVVGGKLTTYRRMAEDALDAGLEATGLAAGACRTRDLPLAGAAPRPVLAALDAPPRLVRRFGTDASLVLATARSVTGLDDATLLAPASPTAPVTLAELVFGVTHEGAAEVEDLLDRRTRVGLVATDADQVRPLAERALALAGAAPV